MNAKLLASPFRRSLALAGVLFALFAVRASAVTISASFTPPFDPFPVTESQPTIGTFNFATHPNWTGGAVTGLGNLNITMTFFGLDTAPTLFDYNHIYLTLGGINTGILLNGYGNGITTLSFNNQPVANEAAIISALNTANGLLTVGLFDTVLPATNSSSDPDSNPFAIMNSTMTLTFANASITPVPFTPVQTLGYGLIGLAVAWRRFRGVNPFALVKARFAR